MSAETEGKVTMTKGQPIMDLDMENSSPTRSQLMDMEDTDKLGLFIRRFGPASFRQIRQIIEDGRVQGLGFNLEDAKQKMKDLDAQYLRTHGGIRTGKKSKSRNFGEGGI